MRIERVSTGVEGLDEILDGGLPKDHAYMIQGEAGTGKTTLGFQFLLAGAARGEKGLYISILQSKADIEEMAASHGWDLSGIDVEILTTEAMDEARLNQQTLLPSSEIQLNEVLKAVEAAVKKIAPTLVVFDSIEQFRLIAGEQKIYQQKAMNLLALFDHWGVTSLFLHTAEEQSGFRTLAHGVIVLELELPPMGGLRRTLAVHKMRNIHFSGGRYSYRIRSGGLVVYPPLPLIAAGDDDSPYTVVPSGNPELDTMLEGGVQRGTACLLAGASGTGKSCIAILYAYQMAVEGEHVAVFIFDEQIRTYKERAKRMNMDFTPLIEKGLVDFIQVNVGDFSAGELGHMMRTFVENNKSSLVVIDSISGYSNSMPGESMLIAHLHDILSYLSRKKVLTLMVLTEHGLFSEEKGDIDVSYIADSVIMLRRFEARGEIRLAVSVVKKRIGGHERTIRELQLTSEGVKVGEPIHEFEAVLTGQPRFVGRNKNLME